MRRNPQAGCLHTALAKKWSIPFTGEPRQDELWLQLRSSRISRPIHYIDFAENFLRGEDTEWHPLNPIADNAIAAIIYACQCINAGDVDSAKWAAVQAYEAADYVAHTLGKLEFGSKEHELVILQAPAVQSELGAQYGDLEVIIDTADSVLIVDELKLRSIKAGAGMAGYAKNLSGPIES